MTEKNDDWEVIEECNDEAGHEIHQIPQKEFEKCKNGIHTELPGI